MPGAGTVAAVLQQNRSWLTPAPRQQAGCSPEEDALLAQHCLRVAADLRRLAVAGCEGGMVVHHWHSGKVGTQMKRASAAGAVYCVIAGGEEARAGTALLRNMATGDQVTVKAGGELRAALQSGLRA